MEDVKLTSNPNEELRIGVYVCHCGKNIAGSVDCSDVAEYASNLPNVILSKHNLYTCSDPGQETIKKDIKEHCISFDDFEDSREDLKIGNMVFSGKPSVFINDFKNRIQKNI